MEIASGSYRTPSRKMSLRRKRSMKIEGNGESPAHKKTSPVSTRNTMKGEFADEKSETTALMSGLLSIKKEKNHAKNEFLSIKNERSGDKDVSNDLDMSQVYHTRRTTNFQTISSVTGFTTPKNRKSKSKIGSSEKKSDEEKHRTNELEEQRLHQHSPDTPFMSSQLLGTQECEVVWDCNSPGFSKDDLKRMCGDTGSDENTSPAIPEFVAPIPNRALFTRTRSRKASNISAVDTTAQLDELLNQLSAKGSLSKDDESIVPTSMPAHYLQGKSASENLKIPRTLPVDKESLPATPPVPINLITKTSSEPFDVWEGSQTGIDDCGDIFESDNQADLGILEETTWDEDLNVALCDVSSGDIVDSSQIKTVNNKSHSCKISEAVDKVKNNDSLDVFDDDYFNDTLIESTQIWEKEILEKGIEKANLHVTTSETKALEDDCFLEKNGCEKSRSFTNLKDKVKKNHCANRSTNMLGKSALLSCPPSEDTDSIKSADEIIRSSPVKDNTQISYSKVENVPQRRMRSSFRLTDNPQTGFLSEKSKQININSINSSKETKSGQKDVVIGNIQNSSGSEVNYTKCDTDIGSNRPLPRFRNIEHNLPKLQNRKALFASGANNISVEKNYGKTDFTKSSFPRSQSTGSSQGQEAKLGISRPSKSEDAEGSREFEEDDSFFDSLLSALPEDEIILGTLKNSEVCDGHNKTSHFAKETVRASKTMFNSSVNSSDKSKVFSRWGDKRKSNNESVKKIVSDQNRNLSSSVVESSFVNSSKRNIPPKRCSMPGEKSMIASLTNSSRIGMSASKLMSYSEDSRELNSKSTLSSSTVKQEFQEKSHTADISDDDLFEDDVLSLIDEVESQFGSQPLASGPSSSQSSQLSLSQQNRCTSEEIAKKKEEAQRRREERLKMEEITQKEVHQSREEKKRQGTQRREEKQKTEEKLRENEAFFLKEETQKAEEMLRKKDEAVDLREEKFMTEEIAIKREEAQHRKNEKLKLDEIARKKEAALRRREERQKSRQLQYCLPVVRK
ncbi:titin homolog [Palaemon carinicauda]|uniref:titin homolog n=1 Tax=Palaemon carinicauda TaxID=392227 RepID=UPI0035B60488